MEDANTPWATAASTTAQHHVSRPPQPPPWQPPPATVSHTGYPPALPGYVAAYPELAGSMQHERELRPSSGWSSGKIAFLTIGILILIVLLALSFGFLLLGAANNFVDQAVPRDGLIGECFDKNTADQQPVSCDSVHHFEVFSRIEYPADTQYPGTLERLRGNETCDAKFEEQMGESKWASEFDYSIPLPNEEQWNRGHRQTVCVLHLDSQGPLTGSRVHR